MENGKYEIIREWNMGHCKALKIGSDRTGLDCFGFGWEILYCTTLNMAVSVETNT
jgi:hypothetical protein